MHAPVPKHHMMVEKQRTMHVLTLALNSNSQIHFSGYVPQPVCSRQNQIFKITVNWSPSIEDVNLVPEVYLYCILLTNITE